MATMTKTVTDVVRTTVTAATSTSTARAPSQASILDGGNPTDYSSSNPIILFIIQAGIIIIFCRLLHYPLSLLRQPRVIAEVIGGILLGPSVMGRIPNFTDTIFPKAAMPNLTLVANLGLILFLFLVGLEVDLRYFAANWRVATTVSVAGMILPFGLGCGISWGLYHDFRDEAGLVPIAFGTYMLFIGIAMAITAFPVLCRILTELKLLSTPVGVIVLSAGVGNDVVGWILLALCVALVNAGSGITALWVLLVCVGYALFLAFAVRPGFMWVLRRTQALEKGPSQSVIALTLLMALTSAFFTGTIGVHPIFGAFMAGLICPHEGGFAIKVTEKVEDLVSALFLPLYFALSGLSTNLGLLNTGITWAYVVGVIAVAFSAKFIGCAGVARLNGLVWRESFTIGALMSCKGLVELIVLNIGLQAKILSTRTFTIFVVMALVTTFITTPLTAALYPPWYQRKLEAWKRGEIDWNTGSPLPDESRADSITQQKLSDFRVARLAVYLRLDNLPATLALVALLGGRPSDPVVRLHPRHESGNIQSENKGDTSSAAGEESRSIEVHGVRLVELTERDSTVMKVSEVDEYSAFDPVLNAFRVLGQLYNFAVSGEVAVVPQSSYAESLVNKAVDESSDLLVLPWSETGSLVDEQTVSRASTQHKLTSDSYSSFVSAAMETTQCNVAVFIDRGFGGTLQNRRPSALTRQMSVRSLKSPRFRDFTLSSNPDRSHHIYVPFLGGADGRTAVRLALQMAESPEITVTITHHIEATSASSVDGEADFLSMLKRSLKPDIAARVFFDTVSGSPVADASARVLTEVGQNARSGGDLIIVGRRAQGEERPATGSCLGATADAILASGVKASLLLVQCR